MRLKGCLYGPAANLRGHEIILRILDFKVVLFTIEHASRKYNYKYADADKLKNINKFHMIYAPPTCPETS